MTSDQVQAPALGVREAPWTERAKALLARIPFAAYVSVALFLVTFVIYHYTSFPTTADQFVYLARAFLHGSLALQDGGGLTLDPLNRPLELAFKDGKWYVMEPPVPALFLLPAVFVFGTSVSQTFASVIVGAVNAPVVNAVVRGVRQKLADQLWLTALLIFGSIYWYAAVSGGVWYIAHAFAVLFLFAAIYFTLVKKNPMLAGAFLGAAYMSRLVTILAFPFFIIMFSDLWLPESRKGRPLLARIDVLPLLKFGVALGFFVALNLTYNFLRFDTFRDAYYYSPAIEAEPWIHTEGLLSPSYMPRHFSYIFSNLPAFQSEAPFVLAPAFGGMAIWATTPAFVYSFFTDIKHKLLVTGALLVFLVPVVYYFLSARGMPLEGDIDFRYGMEYYPFGVLVGAALIASAIRRNKLALACWLSIIPMALVHFSYATQGWAQFGYRFALDYYPFLFLLTITAMGPSLKWHHKFLIAACIVINLWGVLAIYEFDPKHFLDLTWTTG